MSLDVDNTENPELEDPSANKYTLKDITPDTLPSVRGIVSDVMLDIPYYLSPMHNPKMISACIQEANRIYRLWCHNNPGFAEYGRVHLIAHSLGSVMAIDILSQQPTYVDPQFTNPSFKYRMDPDLPPTTHYIPNRKINYPQRPACLLPPYECLRLHGACSVESAHGHRGNCMSAN